MLPNSKLRRRLFRCALPAVLLAATVAMAAPVEHGLPLTAVRSIPAQDELEWCQPLAAGQVLRYRYSASQRLGFSLHWHLRQDGATLLRKDEIRTGEGEFRATFAAEYCLRWQNYDDRSLRLEFDLR